MKMYKFIMAAAALAFLACSCDKGENPWAGAEPVTKPARPEYTVMENRPLKDPEPNFIMIQNQGANYNVYVLEDGMDTSGKDFLGRFQIVNEAGLDIDGLVGEYTIQGSPAEPWLMGNGYYMDLSEYGWGIIEGGTTVVVNDEKQYIQSGKVTISTKEDPKHGKMYVFTGVGTKPVEFELDAIIKK